MSHLSLTVCCGCKRLALCHPAPGTPPDEAALNLYCQTCCDDGLAIYRPLNNTDPEIGFFCFLAFLLVVVGVLAVAVGYEAALLAQP